MKRRVLSMALVLVLAVGLVGQAWAAVSPWAQELVEQAEQSGLVPATLPDDYTQPITRAQFCHLAARLYETATGETVDGRVTFQDTDDADVERMAYLGVVSGIGDGKFNPDGTLNREQAATILAALANAMELELTEGETPLTDLDAASSWARSGIEKMYCAGIMAGTDETTFSPMGTYTIEQSVITMLRLYEAAEEPVIPEEPEEPVIPEEPEEPVIPEEPEEPAVQEPTLTNGQPITEENVLAIIQALEEEYPEGMSWTNANSHFSPALNTMGYGCAGFALICSDAAFGDLPVTSRHSDFDAVKVGDILRINFDTHSVVVLEKRADSVIVTEGNFNSSIHWGREISRQSLEDTQFTVQSRYPQT